jgi:hypothetical protein
VVVRLETAFVLTLWIYETFVEPTIKFVFRAVVQDSDLLDNAITATLLGTYQPCVLSHQDLWNLVLIRG